MERAVKDNVRIRSYEPKSAQLGSKTHDSLRQERSRARIFVL